MGHFEEAYDILRGLRHPRQREGAHEWWFDEIEEVYDLLEDKDFQEEREARRLCLHVLFLLDFVFGRKI